MNFAWLILCCYGMLLSPASTQTININGTSTISTTSTTDQAPTSSSQFQNPSITALQANATTTTTLTVLVETTVNTTTQLSSTVFETTTTLTTSFVGETNGTLTANVTASVTPFLPPLNVTLNATTTIDPLLGTNATILPIGGNNTITSNVTIAANITTSMSSIIITSETLNTTITSEAVVNTTSTTTSKSTADLSTSTSFSVFRNIKTTTSSSISETTSERLSTSTTTSSERLLLTTPSPTSSSLTIVPVLPTSIHVPPPPLETSSGTTASSTTNSTTSTSTTTSISPSLEPKPQTPVLDTMVNEKQTGKLLMDNSLAGITSGNAGAPDPSVPNQPKPLLDTSSRPGSTGSSPAIIQGGVEQSSDLPKSTAEGQALLNIFPQIMWYNRDAFVGLPQGLPVIIMRLNVAACGPAGCQGQSRTQFDADFKADIVRALQSDSRIFPLGARNASAISGDNVRITNVLDLAGKTVVQFVLFPVGGIGTLPLVQSLYRQLVTDALESSALLTNAPPNKWSPQLDRRVFGSDVLKSLSSDTAADKMPTGMATNQIIFISVGAYAAAMILGVFAYRKYKQRVNHDSINHKIAKIYGPGVFTGEYEEAADEDPFAAPFVDLEQQRQPAETGNYSKAVSLIRTSFHRSMTLGKSWLVSIAPPSMPRSPQEGGLGANGEFFKAFDAD